MKATDSLVWELPREIALLQGMDRNLKPYVAWKFFVNDVLYGNGISYETEVSLRDVLPIILDNAAESYKEIKGGGRPR